MIHACLSEGVSSVDDQTQEKKGSWMRDWCLLLCLRRLFRFDGLSCQAAVINQDARGIMGGLGGEWDGLKYRASLRK